MGQFREISIPSRRMHTEHVCTLSVYMCPGRCVCTRVHTWLATRITDRCSELPHEHRQHQRPHPAPLSGWAGWKSTGENIYIYIYIYMYIYVYTHML